MGTFLIKNDIMRALVGDLILATYRGDIKWETIDGPSGPIYEMEVDASMRYVVSSSHERSFLSIFYNGSTAPGMPYEIASGGLPDAILMSGVVKDCTTHIKSLLGESSSLHQLLHPTEPSSSIEEHI